MFRASSRSLWQFASRAPSSRATLLSQSQSFPRSAIVPLLRQQRAVYSSKSDKDDPPPPKQPIDYEAERKRGQELLQSNPSVVSIESSTANTSTAAQGSKSADEDMNSELKHDLGIVKETFTFRDVPRESSMLGLAGTLPYLGTSLSTVFLAWDLNKPIPTGNAFYDAIMIDHETARYFLSVLEPVQLGYGAVIISFLGAIHWGLEYAEKQPLRERTRFRYGMGVASSVVAWPTLMLPVEYALTSQFMAFVALYFADSRAATRGWAPRWYGAYRFLLTAMVGLAIFISLVGRAKIKQGEALTAHGMTDNFSREGIADHETNWEKLEEEERQRQRKAKKEKEEKEAKEAEKKKKEEAKKGKKNGDKKGDKGDDKAKASDKGSDKKSDDKSDAKDKESESKDEGKKQESKDGEDKESKNEGKESEKSEGEDKKSESQDEGKESKGDEKPKEEESFDKESKDDSSKESKQESDKDDKKDSESKDDKKDSESKDDKKESGSKDDKKDEKSKDDKKDGESKDDKQESKDKKAGDKKE
ncbi:hypothetical protein NW762_004641 [Fusarium torreyae]|uniref:MNN4-regulates the mannosylphosphorylation n=1 Tax=Fusarium torreyae TaxID=1237075 RepID=A0A9W8VFW6_9HYPO|nr:hypothetical protein NW762_004641 [Fusarium torreyae]